MSEEPRIVEEIVSLLDLQLEQKYGVGLLLYAELDEDSEEGFSLGIKSIGGAMEPQQMRDMFQLAVEMLDLNQGTTAAAPDEVTP